MRNSFLGIIALLSLLVFTGCGVLSPKVFTDPVQLGANKEWRNDPVVVDYNNDGSPDIVAAHRRPLFENSLHIWLNDNKGGWQGLPQTWTSPGYSGLDVNDINQDGQLDIVAGSHFNRINTLLGKSLGNFETTIMPTADGYVAAKIVDLNVDGKNEIILLGNEKAGIEIYEWDGKSLLIKNTLGAGRIGRDLQVVDMNNDGRLDLVASMLKAGVVIFYQGAGGAWTEAPATNFYSETGEFKSMAIADLNSDGWPDIALNGGWSGPIKPNGPDVFLSKGAEGGWVASSENLKVFKKPAEGIAIGDFNKDGKPDLVVGGNTSPSVRGASFGLFAFAGDGKGNWSLMNNSGLPESGLVRPYGILAKDLNKDGKDDVLSLHSDPEGDAGYVSVILSK